MENAHQETEEHGKGKINQFTFKCELPYNEILILKTNSVLCDCMTSVMNKHIYRCLCTMQSKRFFSL